MKPDSREVVESPGSIVPAKFESPGRFMKVFGRVAAVAGLAGAVLLVWHNDPRTILALMRLAGIGLVLAAMVHVLPMLANARQWQLLIVDDHRPGLGRMLYLGWIRESIDGLLPVARVGGEIVSVGLLRRLGCETPAAAGSIVVDTQIAVLNLLLFTLLGIGYLFADATSNSLRLAGHLAWGAAILAPGLVIFVLIQKANPFEHITQFLNRIAHGRLTAAVGESARVDDEMKRLWRRPWVVLQCIFFLQPVQLVTSSLELWVVSRFMGTHLTLPEAVVFEALVRAINSAAFLVPSALGVQEGGFVVIGATMGLNPTVSLALALARRVRDLLVYVPGLVGWQLKE